MPGPITKQQTREIIRKLQAVDITSPDAPHERWAIYFGDDIIASLGVRRSSKKDIPHPHIPRDLRVSEHFARQIAQCSKYRDDWLQEIGVVSEEEEERGEQEPGRQT